jgi:hypothetical protein
MKGQKKEEWMRLCEMAANEQDSEKLLALVKEINRLLEEKEARLRSQPKSPAASPEPEA